MCSASQREVNVMVFNNDVVSAAELVSNEFVALILFLVVILICLGIAFWYDVLRKPKVKPWVAICWKCKYCIKQRRCNGYATKVSCLTPRDKRVLNYVTGKVYQPTFSCVNRNEQGTCRDYKKVWWRR